MDVRKSHTSEHIFMRALTTINPNVVVKKVVHKENINEIFVESSSLSWDDVVKAAYIANMIILDDRAVRIEFFDSYEAAINKYPNLRAYEERITPPIRVVIIDGFDVAACKMPHLDRTGKAYLFIPISLNKAKKNRFVIGYQVSEAAINYAINASRLVDEVSKKLSCDFSRILNAIGNIMERNIELGRKVRSLTRYIFDSSPEYALAGYRVKYVVAPDIDIDEVGRLTDKWIKDNIGIIVAVSMMDGENRFLLASSKDLEIDLRKVIAKLFEVLGGRGGGRRNWVMGKINKVDGLLNALIDALASVKN